MRGVGWGSGSTELRCAIRSGADAVLTTVLVCSQSVRVVKLHADLTTASVKLKGLADSPEARHRVSLVWLEEVTHTQADAAAEGTALDAEILQSAAVFKKGDFVKVVGGDHKKHTGKYMIKTVLGDGRYEVSGTPLLVVFWRPANGSARACPPAF